MTTIYITVGDVQAQLNAALDAVNQIYTVYGLNITAATFQAHTDYANNYVNALLNVDLSTSDTKYSTAKMAALNLACLRILVVSSGGALVGAYDYFLGDLRVARSGPYASAIQRTIQGLNEDFLRQIVNLTTAMNAADASAAGDTPTYRGGLVT